MKSRQPQNIFEQIKSTKILVYSLVVALLVGTFSFGIGLKTTVQKLNQKDLELNVLFREVGELKEENIYLYNFLKLNRELVNNGFDNLHSSFAEYVETEGEEKIIASQNFLQTNNELLTTLSEKDFAIKNLSENNTRLSEELKFSEQIEHTTNILILGTNQNLTDTILIASINPANESIALISIPRDLFVNGRKINSIYKIFGLDKFKEDLFNITGIQIDKVVVLDFEGFIGMIDIIDGIDVEVKKSLYDPYFPTVNNGYTVYQVDKGLHHFTGEEALMYSRSRKTTSDFDRSERQQQIIQAIRVKLKRFDLINDLDKAIQLFSQVIESVITDIDPFEALFYLNHYQNYALETNNVLSTSNLLYSTETLDGQYILLPKTGDYHAIKKQISELIKN